MVFPPGYLRCANISVVVALSIILGGWGILGSDASDRQLQVLTVGGFLSGIATVLVLLERVDRRRKGSAEDR
jgi:hypothetical protein